MLTAQESYPKLAKAIGVSKIILKREDLHPFGSHKGRSIPQMITNYANQGYKNFIISSSGNAALAAIRLVQEYNLDNPHHKITLKIFIGKNIDKNKLHNLKNGSTNEITIEQTERPRQAAFQMEKDGSDLQSHSRQVKNLRQSTDDSALAGYETLAKELNEIKNLQAIFIPTSSGTTAQALGYYFFKLGNNPQIHIVQTSACAPIASIFDKNYSLTEQCLASAIVDNVAHRKEKVIEIIKNSHGFGWIISDKEIAQAIKLTKEKTDIDISPNSALAIAGLQKALKSGWKFDGATACLITGK